MTAGKPSTAGAADFPPPNLPASSLAWARAVMQRLAQVEAEGEQNGSKAVEQSRMALKALRRASNPMGANPDIYTDDGVVVPSYGWGLTRTNEVVDGQYSTIRFEDGALSFSSDYGDIAGDKVSRGYLSIEGNQGDWLVNSGGDGLTYDSTIISFKPDENMRPRVWLGGFAVPGSDQYYTEKHSGIVLGWDSQLRQYVDILQHRFYADTIGGAPVVYTEGDGSPDGVVGANGGGAGGGTPGGGTGGGGTSTGNLADAWLGLYSSIATQERDAIWHEYWSVRESQTGFGYRGPEVFGGNACTEDYQYPLPLGPWTNWVKPTGALDSHGNPPDTYFYTMFHGPGLSNGAGATSGDLTNLTIKGWWKAGGLTGAVHIEVDNGHGGQAVGGGGGWTPFVVGPGSDDNGNSTPANFLASIVQDDFDHPDPDATGWVAVCGITMTAHEEYTPVARGKLVTDGFNTWLSLKDTEQGPGGSEWAQLGIIDPHALWTLADWFRGDYNPASTYSQGQVTSHNGYLWIAELPTTGNEPGVNQAYWTQFAAATAGGGTGGTGPAGESAYQLALDAGFQGDVNAWLASLHGAAGASAYEIAVAHGYPYDEATWLASLHGADGTGGTGGGTPGAPGESAYQLAVDQGFVGDLNAWLASLKGEPGQPGADGTDGSAGAAAPAVNLADYWRGDWTAA